MSGKKPLDITKKFRRDNIAEFISMTWFNTNSQRMEKINEWSELRDYIFATDTRSTTNSSLPWKNSTTLPKLCQIRDNLHSNYLSALFPNDDWMRFEAYTQDSNKVDKKNAIQAYISNKCRMSGFRKTASQWLLDFIDYGNAFGTIDYVDNTKVDEYGNTYQGYVGPVARRISPLDIVFNPLASSFEDSWKIVRSFKTEGQIYAEAESQPDNNLLGNALRLRKALKAASGTLGVDDVGRYTGFEVDGFGSYFEYLESGYVEVLDFYGDIYDDSTNTLKKQRLVTVIDRMWVIRDEDIPTWFGTAPIFHAGWRIRPDNLWAMGPLDNLVGMQYRIDHLENARADATDLSIMPPLKIVGNVEEFDWHPGAEIHIDEDGDVQELARNVQWVLQAENQIQALEARMELYAGAPREAMGVRSPGEKTAFEVQQIQNAAGRIFQEKITSFEIDLVEPVLNAMLETARRNMSTTDVVRVMDDDLGVEQFKAVTKEDITASGVIRPIGARHFSAQAQLLQNLSGTMNSPLFQVIAPHISSKKLATLWEDILGLSRFGLVKPNVAVFEGAETQKLASTAQEDMEVEQRTNFEGY